MLIAFLLILILLVNDDKVESYVGAVIVWNTLCFVLTEVLSFFECISPKSITMSWTCIDLVLVGVVVFRVVRFGKKDFIGSIKASIDKKSIIFFAFSFVMLIFAIKTVPYNYDSMTYHLPRIYHWFQNGSVSYYATGIDRQVANPVLSEYINLNVCGMLGGSDKLVNVLQCCSYLTDGIIVFFVAKKLNCAEKYCTMAAVLFYSMPIAIAEAFTTQVDTFSSMFMLGFVYIMLDLIDTDEKMSFDFSTWKKVIILALSIALGYLSKPSVCIVMVFFALWLLIVVLSRKDSLVIIGTYISVAALVVIAMLFPTCYRNVRTFGAILAPVTGEARLVGTSNWRYLIINFLKNFVLNMSTSWIANINNYIENGVRSWASFLNVDIDNISIAGAGRQYFMISPQNYNHDFAVNPVMIYLFVFSLILFVIINRKKWFEGVSNIFYVVASLSFLSFCMIARWEPYTSRYMMGFFALLCPAIVAQIQKWCVRDDSVRFIRTQSIIYLLCIIEFVGVMLFHGSIALSSQRKDGSYYMLGSNIYEEYSEITNLVDSMSCNNVGLMLGEDTWEYPYWVQLDEIRLEHVNVKNATSVYEEYEFIPDCIILDDYELEDNDLMCHGMKYTKVFESEQKQISLWKKTKN